MVVEEDILRNGTKLSGIDAFVVWAIIDVVRDEEQSRAQTGIPLLWSWQWALYVERAQKGKCIYQDLSYVLDCKCN